MADPLKKILAPIKELQNIRGVALPIGLEFLQLIVTGPPGAGKSYYIEQIGGWPNEGYLDLTQRGWWKDQSLVFRPREVHLGLPFIGKKEALTVFDKEWLESPDPPATDLNRIRIPPLKKHFFQTNWRDRYIFEFLIPSPSTIFAQRKGRQEKGYFPVDEKLTLDIVKHQVAVYREVALYLHRAGLNVYIRKGLDKQPMHIAEKGLATVPDWTLSGKPGRPSLKTLEGWKFIFREHSTIEWLTLDDYFIDMTAPGRVAHDGRSFELQLGDARLRFQPEIVIGVSKKATQKNWIINTESGCSTLTINGFIRIRVGETVVIGRTNNEYSQLFQFNDTVAKRHISISNHNGDLIITPLVNDGKIRIRRIDDRDYRGQLERGRYLSLLEIRRMYGHRIGPLPPAEALRTIRTVLDILGNEPCRPVNNRGVPGGLVEIDNAKIPVIVGDMHANVDNLLKILSENCLLTCLRMNKARLIILGDAVHSENLNELEKFETSMTIMDLIFKLKIKYPASVFYIRGNHDSFSHEINKNGVLQGEMFREELHRKRGPAYVQAMQSFYEALPYMVCSDSFIACHAGPPRSDITKETIINIENESSLAKELMSNRLQRPNHLAGYTKGDVRRLRKNLNYTAKTRFIVGHTPMDPFGSFWLHAGAIKNHHVIFSAHDDGASVLIRSGNNFMPISFPAEPLTDIINDLI